ncbi:MAG: HEAT repeat domain-containing protein [Planctomycetota bacterium]
MSGDSPNTGEEIQLHFCQITGASIPQSDIDSGLARAVPGGFISVAAAAAQDAIVARGAAGVEPAPASGGGSAHAVVVLFLLYVVGVTSFLLYRELNPIPPDIELPAMATPGDVRAVDQKLEALIAQSRSDLKEVRAVLARHAGHLNGLSDQLKKDADENAHVHRESLARDQELLREVASLAQRTLGMSREVESIIEETMRTWRSDLARTKTKDGNGEPNPPKDPKRNPDKGREDPEVAARRLKVQEHARKLLNRNTPETARYTAAVELGDMKDPSGVDPLMKALETDNNDLVRRGAAWSLGKLGKHSLKAFPSLIRLVGGKNEYVAYTCDKALESISMDATGQRINFGFDPAMKSKQRRRVMRKWDDWWQENRERLLQG